MNFNALHHLTGTQLASLSSSLNHGGLQHGITKAGLEKAVPSLASDEVSTILDLDSKGWNAEQLSYLFSSLEQAKGAIEPLSHVIDLVLSGPSVPHCPTRTTKAVFSELVSGAKTEMIIVCYALYNGMTLLKPLAESMDNNLNLKARLILNISRNRNDTTDSAQLVAKFKNEFTKRTWPGNRLPELWYFPQALDMDWKTRASLHSKVIIVDRRRLFISSANLTDAAHEKNIETGVILESRKDAERIASYFESLADKGVLKII
jgi:hypothetical protein